MPVKQKSFDICGIFGKQTPGFWMSWLLNDFTVAFNIFRDPEAVNEETQNVKSLERKVSRKSLPKYQRRRRLLKAIANQKFFSRFCAFFRWHSTTNLEVMLSRKNFWPQAERKVPRKNVFDRLIAFDWTDTKRSQNAIKIFMINCVMERKINKQL